MGLALNRSRLREALEMAGNYLEALLWSWWSELGVPGWERRHQGWWIDPEALLVFTGTVDPIDPRLRDEAAAWCLRNRGLLSTARVKKLLAESRIGDAERHQPQLGRFLATVSAAWTHGTGDVCQPYKVLPDRVSTPGSLTRAALLSLRLRALLGVTAKAEVVRVFLARPGITLTATDLVNEGVSYTKRAVRDALEDLRLGGFAAIEATGNRKGYRLECLGAFFDLLEPVPTHFPRWQPLLALLRGVLDLTEDIGRFRPTTQPIEIRRSLAALNKEMRGAGIQPPTIDPGSDVLAELERWVGSLLEGLASGRPEGQ